MANYSEAKHSYAEYGSYFLEWPLFAFADSFGNIFVYNAYKNYLLQRIPLDPQGESTDLRICKIYISPDYHLYAHTYSEGVFRLFRMDCRTHANMGLVEEFETAVMDRIENGGYSSEPLSRQIIVGEPVLQYPQDDKKELTGIYVRHSFAENNEKLQVFVLHGKELFAWVQL